MTAGQLDRRRSDGRDRPETLAASARRRSGGGRRDACPWSRSWSAWYAAGPLGAGRRPVAALVVAALVARLAAAPRRPAPGRAGRSCSPSARRRWSPCTPAGPWTSSSSRSSPTRPARWPGRSASCCAGRCSASSSAPCSASGPAGGGPGAAAGVRAGQLGVGRRSTWSGWRSSCRCGRPGRWHGARRRPDRADLAAGRGLPRGELVGAAALATRRTTPAYATRHGSAATSSRRDPSRAHDLAASICRKRRDAATRPRPASVREGRASKSTPGPHASGMRGAGDVERGDVGLLGADGLGRLPQRGQLGVGQRRSRRPCGPRCAPSSAWTPR